MRKIYVGIVVACLVLSIPFWQPARAAVGGPICYVPTDYATITAAVADAGCTTVIVAAGTYSTGSGETFPITINGPRTFSLIGAGAQTTIIDATGGGGADSDAVIVNNATVNISGFTFKGADDDGVEYQNGSSGTIENNVIIGNNYGIYSYNYCTITIRNNLISGNWVDGIVTDYDVNSTMENNTITGNKYGIETSNSNPTIRSNYIVGNTYNGIHNIHSPSIIINNVIENNGENGVYCSDSGATITNNTIVGNTYNGINARLAAAPTIFNNIVVSNGKLTGCTECTGINDDDSQIADGDLDYNDVWDNGADGTNNYRGVLHIGPHNISANPLFATGYHLQCGSPALNAGSNVAPEIPSTDKDGAPRIQDGIVDMGAYEDCQPIPSHKKVSFPSLLPIAQNSISQGTDLLTEANQLLTQANVKGMDTAECTKIIGEANGLLEKAKKSMTNPVCANNLALQAIAKLKDAIECLKALLG